MFRRRTETTSASEPPDLTRAAAELQAARDPNALLESALAQALALAPAAAKGWAVLRDGGGYRVVAVKGYGRELIGLELVGPWTDGLPRVSTNVTGDLFQPNLPDVRAALGAAGMREVRSSLVAPLRGRREQRGALVLDCYTQDPFPPAALEAVTRWASLVTPALETTRELNRYRSLALGLTLAFVEALEASDFAMLGHAQRVTSYATAIGRELNLSQDELRDLWFAAMLHDLGKLTRLDLDGAEHARRGFNMLASVAGLEVARQAILHHHECFDGSGGPDGLAGQAIPLFSRLILVADRYDHLTSERGQLLRPLDAVARLHARAGQELDPALVQVLERLVKQSKATSELRPQGLFPE
ncbi:MAG TPA: HD domain-containing phosphohydrolase [Deinococcales bacterium]|nr:HD domain-containing phosphohydrolase [Deinococcales bacterium]